MCVSSQDRQLRLISEADGCDAIVTNCKKGTSKLGKVWMIVTHPTDAPHQCRLTLKIDIDRKVSGNHLRWLTFGTSRRRYSLIFEKFYVLRINVAPNKNVIQLFFLV